MNGPMRYSPEAWAKGQAIIDRIFKETGLRRTTQLGIQHTATAKIQKRKTTAPSVLGVMVDVKDLPKATDFIGFLGQDGRPTGRGFPCLWSGEKTIRPEARFVPGYDAKLKGQLRLVEKGQAPISSVSREARWFLMVDQLCGYEIRKGKLQRAKT